ncbi:MAG TPA: AEC family transporter [Baekduia sp.]|uniref:AEC family transporter n=1 Tax=Baekduia sp. TaxID=2600305 RepID=UPI002C877C88|nr:AEC family transporter [Baekduia sp.]HMJ33848.1 AEC family transporter [Baekduia sp.]
MTLVALAILASTAIGVGVEQRFRAGAIAFSRKLIDTMVWTLLPFIAFFVVARLHLGGGVGIGLALGFVELAAVGTLAYVVGTRVLHLPRPSVGALILAVILANTGYLGIPLNAALLGHGTLAPAIAWDTIVSQVMLYTAGFAVGAAFGTEAGENPRERMKAFVTRNPVLWALIAGLLAPDALAPQAVVDVAKALAAYTLLPIGFFILGVNLMGEREGGVLRFPPPLTAPIGAAIVLRMVVAPALLVGLSAITVGVPDAYLVQAAMPAGINCLVVGHLYGLDLRLAAGAIAWSTTIAVVAAVALTALGV